ncbi:MAG: nitroreductase family protein [Bacilli bacterium]|nr:nitroreductase family protein [Bacilli bacterium]
MEFENVIRKRTAIRKFSNKILEQAKLDKILEAGRIAPTAKNIQPIKIYVVNTENGLLKIDKASNCRYGAKTVLIVCGNTFEAYHKGDYSTYEMDSCIVATHMMLEATNLGVDNIWIELFDEDILREEFNIPSEYIPVCLLPLGYKTDDCPINPLHEKRKNIEDIVEYK